jgi:hypothetical protein
MKNKKILIIIGMLCCASNYALANETAKINVYFDGEHSFSNISTTSPNFDCKGKGYSYSHAGAYDNNSKYFTLYFDGQFEGDKRKDCKLVVTGGTDKDTYFIVDNFTIGFDYNKIHHTCTIKQQFGTSYDGLGKDFDKLVAQYPDDYLDCSSNTGLHLTYKISPGIDPSPGQITIKAYNDSDLSTINMKVEFKSKSDVKDNYSDIKLLNYTNTCGYQSGFDVSGSSANSDGTELKINVTGPFKGFDRIINGCTTNDGDELYFNLEDVIIGFNYQGKHEECHINGRIGTSHDKVTSSFDKLQGDFKTISESCHVSGFSYKLIPGQTNGHILDHGAIEIFRDDDYPLHTGSYPS